MARKLEVEIVGDASSLHRALNQSSSSWHKWAKAGAVAGVAASVTSRAIDVLGQGLVASIHATLDAQKANARLAVAFKNSGLQVKPYEDRILKLEASSRKLGFTDEQTKDSLGSLITATGSYAKSVKDMTVAQDIARFKGTSLTDATKMLTMAMTGSQRAAKQLGITVSPVTTAYDKLKASNVDLTTASGKAAEAQAKLQDKFATGQAVIDAVTAKVHGQAKAYSTTAAGAMEQFRAQLNHIEVAIGEKLLPVMTRAIQYVVAHWPQITAVIQQAWTAIRPTLVALGDLITSIVTVIRTHWSTIGPIVRGVVDVIKAQLAIVGGVIKFFAAILRGDWSAAWDALKGIVRGAFSEIRAILTVQKDLLVAVMRGIGLAIAHGFSDGVSAGWKLVKDAVTGLFGKVIDWAKHALGIASPSTVFHEIGQNAIKGFVNGVGSMAGVLKSAVFGVAKEALAQLNPLSGGTTTKPGKRQQGGTAGEQGGYHASPTQAQQFASSALASFGWAHDQFAPLLRLWNGESGWEWFARNKSSGAYGIPQSLPASKMSSAGPNWHDNAFTQIMWGLNYIKGRYGSPSSAYSAWESRSPHWYDKGGWLPTGLSLAMNNTGRPERILSPRESAGGNITVPLILEGKVLASVLINPLRNEAKLIQQRTGRPAF